MGQALAGLGRATLVPAVSVGSTGPLGHVTPEMTLRYAARWKPDES
jgi:hypothetical protein